MLRDGLEFSQKVMINCLVHHLVFLGYTPLSLLPHKFLLLHCILFIKLVLTHVFYLF